MCVAYGATCRNSIPNATWNEGTNLVDQPTGPHSFDSIIETRNESFTVFVEAKNTGRTPIVGLVRQRAEFSRVARHFDYFEGADDPALVFLINPRCRARRDGLKPGEHLAGAIECKLFFDARADFIIVTGKVKVEQHTRDVEPGSADQNGNGPARVNLVNRLSGLYLVPRDGRFVGGVEHVDQVVRNTPPLTLAQLCRANVHSAIELHRIRVDNLSCYSASAKFVNRLERETGLARSRGSNDGNDLGHCGAGLGA